MGRGCVRGHLSVVFFVSPMCVAACIVRSAHRYLYSFVGLRWVGLCQVPLIQLLVYARSYLSCDIAGSVEGPCFPSPVCRPLLLCCQWPRALVGVAITAAYLVVGLHWVGLCRVPIVRLLTCAGPYLVRCCQISGVSLLFWSSLPSTFGVLSVAS